MHLPSSKDQDAGAPTMFQLHPRLGVMKVVLVMVRRVVGILKKVYLGIFLCQMLLREPQVAHHQR